MWRHATADDHVDVHYAQEYCIFCDTKMLVRSIENQWPLDGTMLRREHEDGIDAFVAEVEEAYAEHREITSDFHLENVSFHLCAACGWWCLVQLIQYDTPNMPYMAYQWSAGVLARNEPPDIDAPVSEIRGYLCARFEDRFHVNPFQLEDVTASIFRSFGCTVDVTNRSHDGGIDIFGFDRRGRPFGVQVKRYRDRIRVETLRAFVGALVLAGRPNGVFVTTSDFTCGASHVSRQARARGIKLKCADAAKLFEMLKAAQIRDFDQANCQSSSKITSEKCQDLITGMACT